MTFILRGKAASTSAPAMASAVTSSSPSGVTTALPYRPAAKADGVIAAMAGAAAGSPTASTGKTGGVIGPTSRDGTASSGDKFRSVIPGAVSPFTSRPDDITFNDITLKTVNREHKNFNALADLTGLNAQRPGIVALVSFEPVLAKGISKDTSVRDVPFTRVGKHLFEQFLVRKLIGSNIDALVGELQSDPVTSQAVSLLARQFRGTFVQSFSPVVELFHAIEDLEALKAAFEIPRYSMATSPAFEALTRPERFGGVASGVTRDVVSVRLSDLFTSDYHFSDSAFRTFSNTKVLFQLLYELQQVIKNHSYELIRFDVTNHTSDATVATLVKNTNVSPKYAIGFFERYQGITLTQDGLATFFKADDKNGILTRVESALGTIGKELPTNLLDRIALLSSLISKEYRGSSGMSDPDFRSRLTTYGFDADSSTNIVDQLVGDIPDSVTDVLTAQPKGSLSNLFQIVDGDAAVLPFEQKFIDSQNGVYTPGSVYLVDSILNDPAAKFDTSRLQKYRAQLELSGNALTDVLNQLQFINPAKYSTSGANRSDTFFVRMLVELVRATFSNGDLSAGELVGTQNDVLVATFVAAMQDEKLKSLLFTLLLAPDLDAPTASSGTILLVAKDAKEVFFETDITNKIIDRVFSLLAARRAASESPFSKYTKASGPPPPDFKDVTSTTSDGKMDRSIGDEEFRSAFTSDQFLKVRALFDKVSTDFDNAKCFDAASKTRFSRITSLTVRMLVMELMVDLMARFTFAKFVLGADGTLHVQNETTKAQNFRILLDKLIVAGDLQKALQVDVADEADNYDPQLRILARKLNDEELAAKKAYIGLANAMGGLKQKASDVISLFQPGTGKHSRVFNDLAEVIQPEMVGFLDAAQVRLTVAQTQEIMLRAALVASTGKLVQFLDQSIVGTDTMFSLVSLMGEKQFQSEAAENLRIVTVGLPAGFSKHLQERVTLKNVKDSPTLVTKQKDVVRINVYKRDLEFPDIVFKPQAFLFELSRFVSPTVSFVDALSTDNPQFGTFSDVLKKVRTFDVAADITRTSDDRLGTPTASTDILTSDQYSFLTVAQRAEIVKNHTVSQLLAIYIRLLTGVTFDEQSFLLNGSDELTATSLIDEGVLKLLIDNHVKSVAKLDAFDSSTDSVDALNLPAETVNKLVHDLKHLGALAFSRTTLSIPAGEVKRAVTPKIYERIFNIPVDPDDFVIDVTRTSMTPFGEAAFNRLVKTGQVRSEDPPLAAIRTVREPTYKLAERDRKRGSVALEEYFVTVETVLGSEV